MSATMLVKEFDFTGENYRDLTDAIRDITQWINGQVVAERVIAITNIDSDAGYHFVVWYWED